MVSDSRDETEVVARSIQGKNPSIYVSKNEPVVDERKRSELFHIRVIYTHTKKDTLYDSGSQANLISKEIVKKLHLETKLHPKPYPLGWVCDNVQLQVTKQYRLRVAITFGFVDEVDLDLVPLDICGIVLGSPYLYDRKSIFYKEDNRCQLTKDFIEYIVCAHRMKTNLSLVYAYQMKRLVM